MNEKLAQGKYFEDFTIGDEYWTAARTITETDICFFAWFTGDNNAMHTDKEYAEKSMFGERIAHGLLGIAVAGGLLGRLGIYDETAVALLSTSWRFQAPIRIGDTVRCRIKTASKRETHHPDRGIVTATLTLFNQKGEVLEEGEVTEMVLRRPEPK